MDLEFAYYVSLLKKIAQNQLLLDKKFAEEFFSLRRKLYAKRVSPKEFWAGYKKILLTSLDTNKKALSDIFKKTEKTMGERFEELEQEQAQRPPLDLSLPK